MLISPKKIPTINPDLAAAEMCKRKFSFFVKEFWSVIEEDELEWNWHMDVLCDEIEVVYERTFLKLRPGKNGKMELNRLPKLYDLIINVPPGTSKSTIVTKMAPVWSWVNDPSLRHITGSYSAELSTEHAVNSRDIIRSDKYRKYFPNVALKTDQDNKTNYSTTAKGRRFSTSITGTVTGKHAHIITIDDPLNPKQAASADMLKSANDFFDKTLPTRKVNKKVTPTILVMQRLAQNDPTGHLLDKKKEGIRLICLPGEDSKFVTPVIYRKQYVKGLLDARRLDRKVLDELKIDLGAAGYAGQIGQTPVPDGGLVWQKWFREIPDEAFPDPEDSDNYGNDWDLAYTDEEENAASAYIASGKIKEQVYIFDFDFRWLEFPELIKWMKSKPGTHYIEAKASGKSAKQVLTQQGVIAIEVKVKGGRDKVARARSSTPMAEAGIVYIKKSLADRLYNDPRQGILFFPRGQFKDVADALAQMIQRHARKGTRMLGSGQREEEPLVDEPDTTDPDQYEEPDPLDLLTF